jgi:hypothetical protein
MREGVQGHLGTGEVLPHPLERWWRALINFTAAATLVSILARHLMAPLVRRGPPVGGGEVRHPVRPGYAARPALEKACSID